MKKTLLIALSLVLASLAFAQDAVADDEPGPARHNEHEGGAVDGPQLTQGRQRQPAERARR